MKKNKRILIVYYRDTDFVDELTNYLLTGGYRNIESVNSYKDGLRRMKQNHFDIVLMDIFAPDMEGFKYAREIRRLRPETEILLIIEPDHQELVNKELLREARFKCVIKPFIKQNLLESIQ